MIGMIFPTDHAEFETSPELFIVKEEFAIVLSMLVASAGVVVDNVDPTRPGAIGVMYYTPQNKPFSALIDAHHAHHFAHIQRETGMARWEGYDHQAGYDALLEMRDYWIQRHKDVANSIQNGQTNG